MIIRILPGTLDRILHEKLGNNFSPTRALGLAGELIFLKYFRDRGFDVYQSEDMFDEDKDLIITESNGDKKTIEVKTQFPLSIYKAFCERWEHERKLTSVDMVCILSTRNSLNPGFANPTEGKLFIIDRGFKYSKYYYSRDIDYKFPRILIPYEQPKCRVVGEITEDLLEYLTRFNTKRT